ncbi:MAG TPA: hypothetical protein VHB49_10145 [Bradyrhizobium sp.]|nr:hypothetical protein [Bradyrhizobium sp.]
MALFRTREKISSAVPIFSQMLNGVIVAVEDFNPAVLLHGVLPFSIGAIRRQSAAILPHPMPSSDTVPLCTQRLRLLRLKRNLACSRPGSERLIGSQAGHNSALQCAATGAMAKADFSIFCGADFS